MSETLLRVLIGELKTLRITCANCSCAVEVSLGCLTGAPHKFHCPGCGADLRNASSHPDDFARLASVLASLDQLKNVSTVEFVIKPPTERQMPK